MSTASSRTVAYFYDEEIGNFCYGGGNPMRPHRARLVYSLLKSYGLTKSMLVHRPEPRSFEQLTEFHADDYIDFLRVVTPNNAEDHMNQLRRFNMGQIGDVDCPVFDGVYEYCQIYSGGSVTGAAMLATGQADIAFNWSGGMHHAKRAEASGFCYVNDIVLGILELLKEFPRVLYVDIDIHHGDGVEEAFYLTDRVMTVSFHKYGEFFPGTGALDDIGYGKGKHYCVNVPLKDGMDDDNYKLLYEPIMAKVMEMYQPCAIVMCCGADSLSGDKLGCFNLSMEGHSNCIEFLARYNVPMMVLGGGGYTLRNVARCWCYETGRLMGVDLPDKLPDAALHEYNYYLDTGALRISVSNMKNTNTREELDDIKRRVLEHLSQLPPVPSAHMAYVPKVRPAQELPEEDPEQRGGGQVHEERRRVKPGHESDEEEGTGRRRRSLPANPQPDPLSQVPLPAGGPPQHSNGAAATPTPTPGTLPLAMQAASLASSEALARPGLSSIQAGGGPAPSSAPPTLPGGAGGEQEGSAPPGSRTLDPLQPAAGLLPTGPVSAAGAVPPPLTLTSLQSVPGQLPGPSLASFAPASTITPAPALGLLPSQPSILLAGQPGLMPGLLRPAPGLALGLGTNTLPLSEGLQPGFVNQLAAGGTVFSPTTSAPPVLLAPTAGSYPLGMAGAGATPAMPGTAAPPAPGWQGSRPNIVGTSMGNGGSAASERGGVGEGAPQAAQIEGGIYSSAGVQPTGFK
ncbi:hypothetical protein V8C86DRAFT_2471108 [Haematococcus lacustris]